MRIVARLCPGWARGLHRLRRDVRGVAFLEFALSLPIVLGFSLSGIEMSNYIMANNKMQRLASMTADLVAQSGVGQIGASESQIYDLFNAIAVSSAPFDIRTHGRVVITAIKGTDNNDDDIIENRMIWQRFDGGYTAAAIKIGCRTTNPIAVLPNTRVLQLDEMMFHVQVTYRYQAYFSASPLRLFNIPQDFTRVAVFRARSKDFETPTPDAKFPPKTVCTSSNGL